MILKLSLCLVLVIYTVGSVPANASNKTVNAKGSDGCDCFNSPCNGYHCGSGANKPGAHLMGNCEPNGYYYCQTANGQAKLEKFCTDCRESNTDGYDWCPSTPDVPPASWCRCNGIAGDHCGMRAKVPSSDGKTALQGICLDDGYYNCKNGIDQAELMYICPSCKIAGTPGKDSCHSRFY